MEPKIPKQALTNLEKNPGLKGQWVACAQPSVDGKIVIKNNDDIVVAECFAKVRKEIRKHHIIQLEAQANEHNPLMLIADRLYPNIKRGLQEAGINWMDRAGNIYLKNEGHFIWIDHHKTTPVEKKRNRAFNKTGLKIVFLFLHDDVWLNRTYRDIAEAANVALGTIKHVLDGLKQKGFLIKKTDKKYKLIHKKQLLEQWVTAFTDELQPRLHAGNFEFVEEAEQQNWKNWDLGNDTLWGGEPGADLLTDNLKPADYLLYTRKDQAELMTKYKLKPAPDGNVHIYKPFWNLQPKTGKAAPPLVVYMDLIATGEPRNMNIAEEIYEKYLTHIA